MGQHTWFTSSKEAYLKLQELNDEDWEAVKTLFSSLKTKYHDLFRTSKRNEDGTYTDDILTSRDETFKWLENNSKYVSYKHTFDETEKQELENKEKCIQLINEFWDEYPEGIIYFG